jgi:hypothetical protein
MVQRNISFSHPYDTFLSATTRFLSELIAWVSGPWALSLISSWLILPGLLLLLGLPSVFSTVNDKNKVVVAISGTLRLGIELLLYSVAAIAPIFVWPFWACIVSWIIVSVSLAVGLPRMIWLLRGAPATSPES